MSWGVGGLQVAARPEVSAMMSPQKGVHWLAASLTCNVVQSVLHWLHAVKIVSLPGKQLAICNPARVEASPPISASIRSGAGM